VFGRSLSSLGDLDGDGIGDLAVGAPHDSDVGAVWILFLHRDGTVKREQRISEMAGGFGGMLDDDDYFGTALASLGDLDGDGIGDLAVDAPGDDDGGTQQGAVWILFLDTDGTVKSEQKISETAGGFGGVLDDGDNFGSSLASLGDLDGDGIGELAVGAWADDDGGAQAGAVWILFLDPGGTVRSEQKISATAGGFGGTLGSFDLFGGSVSALGDLDDDGIEDLAAGAFWEDDGGDSQGAVWILFLHADGTVKREQKISETSGEFGGTLDVGDAFGSSLASLGDLDGDGSEDLAVGAALDDDGGGEQGAVWILFLDTDGTVKSGCDQQSDGSGSGALDPFDFYGSSLCRRAITMVTERRHRCCAFWMRREDAQERSDPLSLPVVTSNELLHCQSNSSGAPAELRPRAPQGPRPGISSSAPARSPMVSAPSSMERTGRRRHSEMASCAREARSYVAR
jgi:hypothetical protein